jgi:hypothetical protein
MIFRSGGLFPARQKLLAFSRRAYAYLTERPDQRPRRPEPAKEDRS